MPAGGLSTALLRERLREGRFRGAVDFAEWVHGETDSDFLNFSDEGGVPSVPWTAHNVVACREAWRVAEGILERIDELCDWLEAHPAARFAALLDAALAGEMASASPAAALDGYYGSERPADLGGAAPRGMPTGSR